MLLSGLKTLLFLSLQRYLKINFPPVFLLAGFSLFEIFPSLLAVRETVQKAWQFLKSLSIQETEDQTYFFTFETVAEMNRVLDLSTWNIKGHPLILKHWELVMTRNELDFSTGEYWVQVHNVRDIIV
jgi:hypothetical protein